MGLPCVNCGWLDLLGAARFKGLALDLLGAARFKGLALDGMLQVYCTANGSVINDLCELPAQNSLRRLRFFSGVPKLSHVLRCSLYAGTIGWNNEGRALMHYQHQFKKTAMDARLNPHSRWWMDLRRVLSMVLSVYLASAAISWELPSAILTKISIASSTHFKKMLVARQDILQS